MSTLETALSYSDIFTDIDENVFYDGSIDPMGLRIIWTSLGNKIFHNRLNTISTDIRFYTLNLFHHYLVYQSWQQQRDGFVNLIGVPPYNNKNDLEDGIVIFLECLMTHSMLNERDNLRAQEIGLVPGISKLQTLKMRNDKRANYIDVNRRPGILERHHLLGMHGRHKGPFTQMGILGSKDYYSNVEVWKEAGEIFSASPWKQLGKQLLQIIETKILKAKVPTNNQAIRIKADENLLSQQLTDAYISCIHPEVFRQTALVEFWENRLGLHEGEAEVVYGELKKNIQLCSDGNWQRIVEKAGRAQTSGATVVKAIIATEPILTCIDRCINRLLARGTTEVDEGLISFMNHWLQLQTIDTNAIQKFLSTTYFEEDALKRLKRLISIYQTAQEKGNATKFIHDLIEFHTQLMKGRDNLPWLSISDKGSITQHRSYNYKEDQLEYLKDDHWVNGYYLPTVYFLYQGLHGKA